MALTFISSGYLSGMVVWNFPFARFSILRQLTLANERTVNRVSNSSRAPLLARVYNVSKFLDTDAPIAEIQDARAMLRGERSRPMAVALVLSIGLHIALAAVWTVRAPLTAPATDAPSAVVQVRWTQPLAPAEPAVPVPQAEPQTTERTDPDELLTAEPLAAKTAPNAADTSTLPPKTEQASTTVLDLTLPQLPQTEPGAATENGIFHPKLSREFAQGNRRAQTAPRDAIRSYTDSHGSEILVNGTQCMRVQPPIDRHDTATVTLPVRCPWAEDESETFAKGFREALKARGYR